MNTPLPPEDREGPVNGPQQIFCEYIILGLTQQAAYQKAYPNATDDTAKVNGCRLLTYTKIQAEISRLRKMAQERAGSTVMTLAETLEYLSSVIRTPVGQLDPDDALTQEFLEEHTAFGLKKRIKGCDKLKAIELMSRLTGRFQDTLKLDADKVVRVVIGE